MRIFGVVTSVMDEIVELDTYNLELDIRGQGRVNRSWLPDDVVKVGDQFWLTVSAEVIKPPLTKDDILKESVSEVREAMRLFEKDLRLSGSQPGKGEKR